MDILKSNAFWISNFYRFFCAICFFTYLFATPALFLFVSLNWCNFGDIDGVLFSCRFNPVGIEWYEKLTEYFFAHFSIVALLVYAYFFAAAIQLQALAMVFLALQIFTLLSAWIFFSQILQSFFLRRRKE